jgi:GTP-binding protein HflX
VNQSFQELVRTGEQQPRRKAVAVALQQSGQDRDTVCEHLDELVQLADTAGADVLDQVIQNRARPDTTTWLGKGKVAQILALVEELGLDLVLVDDELSPRQAINLEKELKVPVVDRSGLILSIFASRARTREARTQVELAQLRYLLPRLTGAWTHLERQRGGMMLRGPGETQLETDKRLVRLRIKALEEELEVIQRQRETRRAGRDELFRVSLVGYTNAGKSTLLNRLTGAEVFVEDRLFATLDTTVRRLMLKDGAECLLSDTVGFIRKLPHHLVASFRSTLEEAAEADLLLHVVDLAHPSWSQRITSVRQVLEDLGAGATPVLYLFNKVDRVEDPAELQLASSQYTPSLLVSATREIRLDELVSTLSLRENESWARFRCTVPWTQGKLLGDLRRACHLLEEGSSEHGFEFLLRIEKPRRDAFVREFTARGCILVPA